jgi:hypothetical protein
VLDPSVVESRADVGERSELERFSLVWRRHGASS